MDLKWIKLESVSSTNHYIAEMIRNKEDLNELVVVAGYQEYGKGQGKNIWHSNKGENLLMSVLLYPAFLSASSQFQLSIMTSLAVFDTLESVKVKPIIKWPNDILTSQGKIAGILIENGIKGGSIFHTIIGIGVNVNQIRFPDFPVKATSLAQETGNSMDPDLLAEILSKKILERYRQLIGGTENLMKEEYLKHLYMIDQPALFSSAGKEFSGVIRGISDFGELLVESKGVVQSYGFHSIRLTIS